MTDDWSSAYRALTGDNVDNVDNLSTANTRTHVNAATRRDNVNTVNNVTVSKIPIMDAFSTLERRCPDHVDVASWQQAIEDGRRFVVQWGEQAEVLGWTADDLFGLQSPPERAGPTYRRLSRYDVLGLIWLLRGRRVLGMTTGSAAIEGSSGAQMTFHRRMAP